MATPVAGRGVSSIAPTAWPAVRAVKLASVVLHRSLTDALFTTGGVAGGAGTFGGATGVSLPPALPLPPPLLPLPPPLPLLPALPPLSVPPGLLPVLLPLSVPSAFTLQ